MKKKRKRPYPPGENNSGLTETEIKMAATFLSGFVNEGSWWLERTPIHSAQEFGNTWNEYARLTEYEPDTKAWESAVRRGDMGTMGTLRQNLPFLFKKVVSKSAPTPDRIVLHYKHPEKLTGIIEKLKSAHAALERLVASNGNPYSLARIRACLSLLLKMTDQAVAVPPKPKEKKQNAKR